MPIMAVPARAFKSVLLARPLGLLLWLGLIGSALVLLAEIILVLAGIQHTETISGPFQAETAGSAAFSVPLNTQAPRRYLLDTGGDTPLHPYRSNIAVALDGIPLGPAHASHDGIRTGSAGAGAYSHWADGLIFSLPQGVANAAGIMLTVRYAWSLRDGLVDLAVLGLLLCGVGLLARTRLADPGAYDRFALVNGRLFLGGSAILWAVAFACALAYLASIALAWFQGWALPNVAIFSYLPLAGALASIEPFLAHIILFHAALGAILAWATPARGRADEHLRRQEAFWIGLFSRFGLVLVVALFLFSIGSTWSGLPRAQDLSFNAIAGLVPFNDATGHFAETFSSITEGRWNDFASRRPLAAAMRSLGMLLSGYDNVVFLVLQTILLAIATFFAVRAVMRWRGLWAGVTFLGLSIVLVRPYLPSNLTEPIAILLAMVSVPLLIRAFTAGRIADKASAFLLTGFALSVRMGNMLALPAMALWWLLSGGRDRGAFLRNLGTIVGALALISALTGALSLAYGSQQGQVGSNFSYVFCGLTHGGNWTTCDSLYKTELKGLREDAVADLLYARGFEMLLAQPLVLVDRLVQNMRGLAEALPLILLNGYVGQLPSLAATLAWLVVAVFGLVRFIGQGGMDRNEKIFWILFVLSLFGSAAIIFADDGLRVLCVSYPVLNLLVSSGFASRAQAEPAVSARPIGTVRQVLPPALIAVVMLACLCAPWIGSRFDPPGLQALARLEKAPGEAIYLPARYMAGFLVVPDGSEADHKVPTIAYSNFRQIIANSRIEQYGRIDTPAGPFGFVIAPGLVVSGGAPLVVPPEMLTDRAALGWRVTYASEGLFKVVDKATPITALP